MRMVASSNSAVLFGFSMFSDHIYILNMNIIECS